MTRTSSSTAAGARRFLRARFLSKRGTGRGVPRRAREGNLLPRPARMAQFSGQGGKTVWQKPETHSFCAHTSEPSEQTWQTSGWAGVRQSAFVVHGGGAHRGSSVMH